MAAASSPLQLSASKLRRLRAMKTKQKLHDMARKSDSLQQVHCQLAMLTSTVNNLVLVLSKSNVDSCMTTMPYLMGSTSWSATSHEDVHFPDAIEASTPSANPCGAEVGREGQAHQCEAPPTPTAIFKTDWKGHGTEPSASHLSVDASRPTSQTSVITSRSIADIIDQLDQGLVRAVEFYDSCKTLVVAMADGQTQAVASIPQDSLSQVLAKLRVNKVRMKSYFNKKFELPVQPGNVENSTPASPGGVNSAGNPADDADCLFLEQRLELCLKPMQDNFANMEPCENREDVLNDIVEAGISAIQAAMTSDRSRDLMKYTSLALGP